MKVSDERIKGVSNLNEALNLLKEVEAEKLELTLEQLEYLVEMNSLGEIDRLQLLRELLNAKDKKISSFAFANLLNSGKLVHLFKKSESGKVEPIITMLKMLEKHSYIYGQDTQFDKKFLDEIHQAGDSDVFEKLDDVKSKLLLFKLTKGNIQLNKNQMISFINKLDENEDINSFDEIEWLQSLQFNNLDDFIRFSRNIVRPMLDHLYKKIEAQENNWLNDDPSGTSLVRQYLSLDLSENVPSQLHESYRKKLLDRATDSQRFKTSSPFSGYLEALNDVEQAQVIDHLLTIDADIDPESFRSAIKVLGPTTKGALGALAALYERYGLKAINSFEKAEQFHSFLAYAPAGFIKNNYDKFKPEQKYLAISYTNFRRDNRSSAIQQGDTFKTLNAGEAELASMTQNDPLIVDRAVLPTDMLLAQKYMPKLMTRVIQIFKLLSDEQIAGSYRHQSTFALLRLFANSPKPKVDDWAAIYQGDSLLREAWRLACILDDNERAQETYLAVFKQSIFGISNATGSTIFFTASLRKDLSKLQTDAVQEGKRMHKVLAATG